MTNDIQIDLQIAQNRKPISVIGSTLGAQYAVPEAKSCNEFKDYTSRQQEVRNGNNIDFCLNRAPRKVRMLTHDIRAHAIEQNPIDQTLEIVINGGHPGELRIPVGPNLETAGVVTDDAIGRALRGEDPNIFFSDQKKLATIINNSNRNEIARLKRLRDQIDKAMADIESTIAQNEKKAELYAREMQAVSTAQPNIDTAPATPSTTIIVSD